MKSQLTLLILFLSLGLSACSSEEQAPTETPSESQTEERVENVQVLQVRPGRFVSTLELTGTTEPWKSATISSELGGRLDSLRLSEGQSVQRGQTVAGINAQVLQAQKEQAAANLRLSQVQEKWQSRNQAKQVSLAEAQYNNTASTFARQDKLYKEQVVSAQTYDNSQTNLTNAKLQLEMQQISKRSSQDINREQTRVAASNLKLARVNLSKAAIRSPLSGYINKVYVEQGEMVSPGVPIADVVQISPIKVVVGVPEREISSLTLGQEVSVRFEAISDQPFKGFISFIPATADRESRTFPIQVRVPNPNLRIKGGMIGRVSFARKREQMAIVLPQDAVIDQADGRYVYIAEDDRAKKVKVELGQREGSQVVINNGLSGGQAVIIFGQRNLLNDQKINIQEYRYQGVPKQAPQSPPPASEAPAQKLDPKADQTASPTPSASGSAATHSFKQSRVSPDLRGL